MSIGRVTVTITAVLSNDKVGGGGAWRIECPELGFASGRLTMPYSTLPAALIAFAGELERWAWVWYADHRFGNVDDQERPQPAPTPKEAT